MADETKTLKSTEVSNNEFNTEWTIVFIYMPYTVFTSILLSLARYTEMKEENIKQRKATEVTIVLLLSILGVIVVRNKLF